MVVTLKFSIVLSAALLTRVTRDILSLIIEWGVSFGYLDTLLEYKFAQVSPLEHGKGSFEDQEDEQG